MQLRPCSLLFCPTLVRGEGLRPPAAGSCEISGGRKCCGVTGGHRKGPSCLTFLPKKGTPRVRTLGMESHIHRPHRPSSCGNGATEETGGELPRLPSLPSSP